MKHLIQCEDCSAITPWEVLSSLRWKCPECGAVMAAAPTQKQLDFAANLGIEKPEQYCAPELGSLIAGRQAEERREMNAYIERVKESRRPHKALKDATAEELLREVTTRHGGVLIIQGSVKVDVREFQMSHSLDCDPFWLIHALSFYAAIGEWPRSPAAK